MPPNNYLQNQEADELSNLSERVQMSKSGAFKDLKDMLDTIVEEAHEAIVGCLSDSPNAYMRLVIRYQQRLGVKREVERWVESAEQGLTAMTEAMRQDLENMREENEWQRQQ